MEAQRDSWYIAEKDYDYWLMFCRQWQGARDVACLDMFSASGRMAAEVRRLGLQAITYDIRAEGPEEDIASRIGFFNLLLKGLRLAAKGLLFLGPPCSMFIFLSSSQHQRSTYGPMGNPLDESTQLSNIITWNAVPCQIALVGVVQCL